MVGKNNYSGSIQKVRREPAIPPIRSPTRRIAVRIGNKNVGEIYLYNLRKEIKGVFRLRKRKNMRLPNNYGGVVYLGENRRKPYGARITIGFEPKGEKDGVMQYRQKYKYIGFFEKQTQALECLVEYNKNPYDLEKRKITFAELYNEWSGKHYDKIAANTAGTYKTAFQKCAAIHNIEFYKLKTEHLQGVVDDVPSSSIARNVKLLLGLIYKYALKYEIVEKDYSAFVEPPKLEKKRHAKPLTADEIAKLWEYEGNIYADMLLILLYSGMRIGELLVLENANINLAERYMVGGIKTEAGIDRVIPIHSKIAHLLEKNITAEKYLYHARSGNPFQYTNIRKKAAPFFKSIGLEHTFHDARHTFVSQASRLEFNQLILKRIVGHSNKDITDHYTHKDIADLIAAIDKFDY